VVAHTNVCHGKPRIDKLLIGLPALFWSSSYVASSHLVVAPQAIAKDQFCSTVLLHN